MKPYHENILILALIGSAVTAGKILSAGEPVTWKLFLGRVILGSAVSLCAGTLLLLWPGISPLAVAGAGSVLGIAGYQCIELWLQRYGAERLTHWLRRMKK